MDNIQKDINDNPLIEGRFYDIFINNETDDDINNRSLYYENNIMYMGLDNGGMLRFKNRKGVFFGISPNKVFRRFTGPKKYIYRLSPEQKYKITDEETDTEDISGGKRRKTKANKKARTRARTRANKKSKKRNIKKRRMTRRKTGGIAAPTPDMRYEELNREVADGIRENLFERYSEEFQGLVFIKDRIDGSYERYERIRPNELISSNLLDTLNNLRNMYLDKINMINRFISENFIPVGDDQILIPVSYVNKVNEIMDINESLGRPSTTFTPELNDILSRVDELCESFKEEELDMRHSVENIQRIIRRYETVPAA